ncbi:hypothetical protein K2X33_13270 [bacterium]|nr:hypothetical protein [bacterium]
MKKIFCALLFLLAPLAQGATSVPLECQWILALHPDLKIIDETYRNPRGSAQIYTRGTWINHWDSYQLSWSYYYGQYFLRNLRPFGARAYLPKDAESFFRIEGALIRYGRELFGLAVVPYVAKDGALKLFLSGNNQYFNPIGEFQFARPGTKLVSWMIVPGEKHNHAVFLLQDPEGNYRLDNLGFLSSTMVQPPFNLAPTKLESSSLPLGQGSYVLFRLSATPSTTTVGLMDLENGQMLYYNAVSSTLSDGRSADSTQWTPKVSGRESIK